MRPGRSASSEGEREAGKMSLQLNGIAWSRSIRARGTAGARAILRSHDDLIQGGEVVLLLGFLLYYIWVMQPAGHSGPWPAFALFMAFSILTHFMHGDR